jgi:hypothetical protein
LRIISLKFLRVRIYYQQWPLRLRGRFDYGKEQAHYMLMSLSYEDEWKNYVEVIKSSSIRCLEVVVEKGCSPNCGGCG